MGRKGENAGAALIFSAAILLAPAAQAQTIADISAKYYNGVAAQMRAMVGKPFWVMSGKLVEFCPVAAGEFKNCKQMRAGETFKVTGVDMSGCSQMDKDIKDTLCLMLKVVAADGRQGFVPMFQSPGLLSEEPSLTKARLLKLLADDAAECERRGQPKVGTTAAQAIETCWHQPKKIIKKTTATGVSEDYIYSIGHILRFQDGVVAEVIETR